MFLFDNLKKAYSKEHLSAREAQYLAHIYSWGPVVFQVARLMNKYGIFEMLNKAEEGLTQEQVCDKTKLSPYAVKCLLESALTMHTVLLNPDTKKFT